MKITKTKKSKIKIISIMLSTVITPVLIGNAMLLTSCKMDKNNNLITTPPTIEGESQKEQDIKLINEIVEKINKMSFTLKPNSIPNINDVNEQNIDQYVDNFPKSQRGIDISIKKFEKNISQGSILVIFLISKNNQSKETNEITISGFTITQLPEITDEQNVDNVYEIINKLEITVTNNGVIIDEITEDNIKNYVSNWPLSLYEENVLVELCKFSKDISKGSVTIKFLISKNNYKKTIEKTINNFKVNDETNPPIIPPTEIEPPLPPAIENDATIPNWNQTIPTWDEAIEKYINRLSEKLPIVNFNVNKEELHKDKEYHKATISLRNENNPKDNKEGLEAEIKVRGNSTSKLVKKPYRIKFNSKQDIFGLNGGQKYKNWSLLAEWTDASFIRNQVMFLLSQYFI